MSKAWDELRLEKTETELKKDLLYGGFLTESRRGSKLSSETDDATAAEESLLKRHSTSPPTPDRRPGPPRKRKPRKSHRDDNDETALGFRAYDGPRDPFGRRKKGEGYVLARWTGDNAGASGVFKASAPGRVPRVQDSHVPLHAAHEVSALPYRLVN